MALGCLALVVSGCNLDVFNPGAITEESLNDASLMGVVVNGVANEFNQIVDGAAFDIARFSDELAGTGSYFQTGRLRRGVIDWEETAGVWGQVHETIWTGEQAWARMQSLESFDQDNSDIAARAWMLVGHAHRFFGELFCEVIYSAGTETGAGVEDRDVAFQKAIQAFDQAIAIGGRAGSDADDFVTASHAGKAQAYVGLGQWSNAVAAAGQVPTAFVLSALMNQTTNSNFVHDETWDRNEGGVYGSYAWRIAPADVRDGSGGLSFDDPRAPWTICGLFDASDGELPFTAEKDADVSATNQPGCTSQQGADGVTAHYRQDKYPDDGSDIPFATGVEMRLIEAEAALQGTANLATFTARINEVRDHYNLPLIDQPATVGALEYPNAYNASTGSLTVPTPGQDAADIDALSILDAERWLTNWLQGRRMWDLHRWDHPFLVDGIVFWDVEAGGRVSCYPVPEQECQLNETLTGATLKTGLGNATQTCG